MWYDADIDALMTRTARRPLPMGRIKPGEALAFGLTLSAFAVVVLGLLVNILSAALLAFTIFFYVAIYTMWLKRSTPQNIVIGGAAGAFPPMIGWAAVTGSMSFEPILLFLIIFFWTPPHFWALALFRSDDYARAGIPMLPVVAGPDATRLQILLYTIVLVAIALAPWPLGYFDAVYGVTSLVLGAGMLWLAIDVYRLREGVAASRATRRLFAFSIFYLFALFAVLLAEVVVRAIAPLIG
jgi:protoheme IX farnesyltransferase